VDFDNLNRSAFIGGRYPYKLPIRDELRGDPKSKMILPSPQEPIP
jgi:hypothetical protein